MEWKHNGRTGQPLWYPTSVLSGLADRRGDGGPTFPELLATAEKSAIHLEARDTYAPFHPAFQKWLNDADISAFDWKPWIGKVTPAVQRGVRMRRLRIVSEPVSDYIRWEHAISYGNIQAGEDLRWLPRHLAYDLPIPIADYWMFDQHLIRYNYTSGSGVATNEYDFVTDPHRIIPIAEMFERTWERGIPHAEYQPA